MRKRFLVVFIAALILSACGASTAGETPSATQVGGKTPKPTKAVETASRLQVEEEALDGLEIAVWHPWFGVQASLFEAMVKDFNTNNEWGIKVSATGQANLSSLYENVTTSLPTPERPDLAIALPEHALGWDVQELVTDMTHYVEDPFYGLDQEDFPSAFWEQDKLEERRVAFPAQRTARLLLWNQTWAGELGFDAPPDSPDAFRQQACRAHQTMLTDETTDNDGRGGWVLDTEPMTAYSWLLAFDGGALEDGNYRFLGPNNISAFGFLKKLAEEGCAWQTSSDPLTDFAARQALFITASLEDLPAISRAFATADNSDKWTVFAFPGNSSDVLVVYGSSYVMLDSTPEEQLATWIFIRWMLEPEQDARLVEATHLFPLRTSALDLLADYEDSHPQWAEAVKLLPEAEMQPQLASWRMVKVMLGDGFHDMMTRTDLSSGQVARVLQQMQDIARDLNQ